MTSILMIPTAHAPPLRTLFFGGEFMLRWSFSCFDWMRLFFFSCYLHILTQFRIIPFCLTPDDSMVNTIHVSAWALCSFLITLPFLWIVMDPIISLCRWWCCQSVWCLVSLKLLLASCCCLKDEIIAPTPMYPFIMWNFLLLAPMIMTCKL